MPENQVFGQAGGGGEHLRVFSLVEQSSDRVFVIKTTGGLCIHQKVEYVRKACCPVAARDMLLTAADHITRSDEKRNEGD